MPAGNITDPSKMTVVAVEGTMADIHTLVQASLRSSLATGDSLYDLNFVRSVNGNKVICYIMFEDQ
tara:strand:+ start:350 stop:547 length:198 start_codon:yes stop_codon:yes gene_type:complete